MSADDENKISENRRRLFKALSTAPVVMTLRPGEALANASAFQCATKEMPQANNFYNITNQICTNDATGEGCHAFEERDFWDPAGFLDTDIQCEFWNDKFVVRTSADTFFAVTKGSNSAVVVNQGPANNPNGVELNGGQLTFFGQNGDFICARVPEPQQGLFLAVGGPVLDGNGHPIGWASDGVWPEETTDGATNVLGGSCLTSFPDSLGFTLADS